jgi:hypothetical protein
MQRAIAMQPGRQCDEVRWYRVDTRNDRGHYVLCMNLHTVDNSMTGCAQGPRDTSGEQFRSGTTICVLSPWGGDSIVEGAFPAKLAGTTDDTLGTGTAIADKVVR